MVNKEYYIVLLDGLNHEIKRKRPHLTKKRISLIKIIYTPQLMIGKIYELGWELFPRSPYDELECFIRFSKICV